MPPFLPLPSPVLRSPPPRPPPSSSVSQSPLALRASQPVLPTPRIQNSARTRAAHGLVLRHSCQPLPHVQTKDLAWAGLGKAISHDNRPDTSRRNTFLGISTQFRGFLSGWGWGGGRTRCCATGVVSSFHIPPQKHVRSNFWVVNYQARDFFVGWEFA